MGAAPGYKSRFAPLDREQGAVDEVESGAEAVVDVEQRPGLLFVLILAFRRTDEVEGLEGDGKEFVDLDGLHEGRLVVVGAVGVVSRNWVATGRAEHQPVGRARLDAISDRAGVFSDGQTAPMNVMKLMVVPLAARGSKAGAG